MIRTGAKKSSYLCILIIIITLMLSPISLANQEQGSSLNIAGEQGLELGGFAKIKPVSGQDVYTKSEKTPLMQGGIFCGNIYVKRYTSGFYCNEPVSLALCCPNDGDDDGTYGTAGYPEDYGDCVANYASDVSSEDLEVCTQGCCYCGELDTDDKCLEGTENECASEGCDFYTDSCDELRLTQYCTEGPGQPPEETCDYTTQEDCTAVEDCAWCDELEPNRCVVSCASQCGSAVYEADNVCTTTPTYECADGGDNDSDGDIDGADLCCALGNADEDGCECKSGYRAIHEIECTSNGGRFFIDDGTYFDNATGGFSLGTPDGIDYAGCCNVSVNEMPPCLGPIATSSNLGGYCRCEGQIIETARPPEAYCCDNILTPNSCDVYDLDIRLLVYKLNGQSVDPNGVTFTVELIKQTPPASVISQTPFWNSISQQYEYSDLFEGTYLLTVSGVGGDGTAYGPNSTTLDIPNDLSVTLILNEAVTVPELCDSKWPKPELVVTRVDCDKSLNVSWDYPCADYLDSFSILVTSTDDGYSEAFPNLDNTATYKIFDGMQVGERYDFNLTIHGNIDQDAIAAGNNTDYSTGWTIGEQECVERDDCTDLFCNPGVDQRVTCENNQMVDRGGCPGGCIEKDNYVYCIQQASECKDIFTSPAVGENIFGLYYYDYTDDCYFDESNERTSCYYDIYNTEEDYPDTPTDVCISCQDMSSCFDYRSEFACNGTDYGDACTRALSPDGCGWYTSPENFASLGMGLCYDPAYEGTEYCDLCSQGSDDLFKTTGCTPEICSRLGACIANYDHTSCNGCNLEYPNPTTCYAYQTDEVACVGSDGWNDPLDPLTPEDEEIDSCGLDVCGWNGFNCIKDGDSDGSDDCSGISDQQELEECQADYSRPRTTVQIPDLNSEENPIVFTITDEFPEDNADISLYYCISLTQECTTQLAGATTASSNTVSVDFPADDFLNYEGPAYLEFYSIDQNKNKEKLKSVDVYIDTIQPTVDVSWTITNNSYTPDTSDLTILLNPSQDLRCIDGLTGDGSRVNLTGDLVTTAGRTVTFEDLPDRIYRYNLDCRDDQGNPAIITNGPLYAPFDISIDRIVMIDQSDVHPTFADGAGAVKKNGAQVMLELSLLDTNPLADFTCSYQVVNGVGLADGDLTEDHPSYYKSVSTTGLTEGQFDLDVTCENNANPGQTDTTNMNFYVDKTAPETKLFIGITEFPGTDDMYASVGSTIRLECEGQDISQFLGDDNDCNTTKYCTAIISATDCPLGTEGDFTIDEQTPNAFTFCYGSTDYADNEEFKKCRKVYVDANAPTINTKIDGIDVPLGDFYVTDGSTIDLQGSNARDDESKVEIVYATLGETTIDVPNSGTPPFNPLFFSGIFNLADGYNELIITAINYAGKIRSGEIYVYKDAYAPEFVNIDLINEEGVPADEFEYFTPVTILVEVNDSNYTALRGFQDNSVILRLTRVDENGDPIGSTLTMPMDNSTPEMTEFNITLLPQLMVGNYTADLEAIDEFGNSNHTVVEFEVIDSEYPKLNISVYIGEVETDVITTEVEYLVNITSTEPLFDDDLDLTLYDPLGVLPNYVLTRIDSTGSSETAFSYRLYLDEEDYGEQEKTLTFNTEGKDFNGNWIRAQDIIEGSTILLDSRGPGRITWHDEAFTEKIAYSATDTTTVSGIAEQGTVELKVCKTATKESEICDRPGINTNVLFETNLEQHIIASVDIINANQVVVTAPGIELRDFPNYFEFENDTYNRPNGAFYNITAITKVGNDYTVTLDPALPTDSGIDLAYYIYDKETPNGFFEVTLSDMDTGGNYYRAFPYDNLGNEGDISKPLTVYYDPNVFVFEDEQPRNGVVTNYAETNIEVSTIGWVPVDEDTVEMEFDGDTLTKDNLTVTCEEQECLISYDPPADLAEGNYGVVVRADDLFTRSRAVSWSFEIDYEAPSVNQVWVGGKRIDQASDYINNETPTIEIFFGEPVELTGLNLTHPDETEEDITIYCPGSGVDVLSTWTCYYPLLEDTGEYELVINARREPGSSECREVATFIFDDHHPTISNVEILEAEDAVGFDLGRVRSSDVTLRFDVSDDNIVDRALLSGDIDPAAISIEQQSQTIERGITLLSDVDGELSFMIKAIDMADNEFNNTYTVTLDKPLEVSIILPADEVTDDPTPTIEINTMYDDNTQWCNISYVSNDSVQVNELMDGAGLNAFTYNVDPANALNWDSGQSTENIITFICMDTIGDIIENDVSLFVDQEEPTITAFELLDAHLIFENTTYKDYRIIGEAAEIGGSTNVAITASEDVNCDFTIGGTTYPVGPDNDLEYELDYADGDEITVEIDCEDLVGIPAETKTIHLIVNSSEGILITNMTPQGLINQNNPLLTVETVQDSRCGIKFQDYQTEFVDMDGEGKTHTLYATGLGFGTLQDGITYGLDVNCSDINTGVDAFNPTLRSFEFTVDLEDPWLSVDSPIEGGSYDYILEVNGSIIDDNDVTIIVQVGGETYNTTVNSIGPDIETPYSLNVILSPGENTLIITAVDEAGNPNREGPITRTVYYSMFLPQVTIDGKIVSEANTPLISNEDPQLIITFAEGVEAEIYDVAFVNSSGGSESLYCTKVNPNVEIYNCSIVFEGNLIDNGNYKIEMNASLTLQLEGEVTAEFLDEDNYHFVFDNIEPTITSITPTDGFADGDAVNRSIALKVAATDTNGVENIRFTETNHGLTSGGGVQEYNSTKEYDLVLAATEGDKNVVVTVTDPAGNTGVSEFPFVLNAPTEIEWVSPLNLATTTATPLIRISTSEIVDHCTLEYIPMDDTVPVQVVMQQDDYIHEHQISAAEGVLNHVSGGNVVNNIAITCEDNLTDTETRNFDLIVDMDVPEIEQFGLAYEGNAAQLYPEYSNDTYKFYYASPEIRLRNNIELEAVDYLGNPEYTKCEYIMTMQDEDPQEPVEFNEDYIRGHQVSPEFNYGDGDIFDLEIICEDKAGHLSEPVVIHVEVDGTPAVKMEIIKPKDGSIIGDKEPMVAAQTLTRAECQASIDYEIFEHMVSDDGIIHNMTYTDLEDAETYRVEVVCSDLSGHGLNESGDVVTFTTDWSAPNVTITDPEEEVLEINDSSTIDAAGTITGAAAELCVYNGEEEYEDLCEPYSGTDFAFNNLPLYPGLNEITVIARDNVGNAGNDSFNATVLVPLPLAFVEGKQILETGQTNYVNTSTPTILLDFLDQMIIQIDSLTIEGVGIGYSTTLIDTATELPAPLYERTLTSGEALTESGTYRIRLTARQIINEEAGTPYTDTYDFYYDGIDPVIAITAAGTARERSQDIYLTTARDDESGLGRIVLEGDFEDSPIELIDDDLDNEYVEVMLTEGEENKNIMVTVYDKSERSASDDVAILYNKGTSIDWFSPASMASEDPRPEIEILTPGEPDNICRIGYPLDSTGVEGSYPMARNATMHYYQLIDDMRYTPGGTQHNTVSFNCTDKFSELWMDEFGFAIDQQAPIISAFELTSPDALFAETDDYKHYLFTEAGESRISLTANEDVKCYYDKMWYDGTDYVPDPNNPYEFSADQRYYDAQESDLIEYSEGQSFNMEIFCEDRAGVVSDEDKTIHVEVNGDAMVEIIDYNLDGEKVNYDPTLEVVTLTQADCTADGVPMNSADGITHTYGVSVEAGVDQEYVLDVTCSDASGLGLEDGSQTITFNTDYTGPVLTIVYPEDLSKEINSTLTFSITGYTDEDDSTVIVERDGITLAEATSDALELFVMEDMLLRTGLNNLIVSTVDSLGNSGDDVLVQVNANVPLPDVYLDNDLLVGTKFYTINDNPQISLEFMDELFDAELEEVRVTGPNYNEDITTTCDLSAGRYQCELTDILAEDGMHTITVRAAELSGGEKIGEAEQDYIFYLDKNDPELSITVQHKDGAFVDKEDIELNIAAYDYGSSIESIVITGDIVEDITITEFDDSSNVQLMEELSLIPGEGDKMISVTVTDVAGRSVTETEAVTLNLPTDIIWLEPEQGRASTAEVTVRISALDDRLTQGCTLKYLSNTITMSTGDNVNYSATLTGLALTTYDVTITCQDYFGQYADKSFDLVIEGQAPEIDAGLTYGYLLEGESDETTKSYLITDAADGVTNLGISASEPVTCIYTVNDSQVSIDYTLVPAGEIFTPQIEYEDGDTFEITINCEDVTGFTADTKYVNLEVNSAAVVSVTSITPRYTNDENPTIQVTTGTQASCTAGYGATTAPMGSGNGLLHSTQAGTLAADDLVEGDIYEFDIICTDTDPNVDLNTGIINIEIMPDYTAPTLLVTQLDQLAEVPLVNLTVVANDELSDINLTVYVNETSQYSGIFSAFSGDINNIALGKGENIIKVTAVDEAGNVNENEQTILSLGTLICVIVDGEHQCYDSGFFYVYYLNLLNEMDETCFNDIQDEDETDLNCGDGCIGCPEGMACIQDSDCFSWRCVEGICQ